MLEQISSKTKPSGVMLSTPVERQSLPEKSGFATLLASSLESPDKSPVSTPVGLLNKKNLLDLDVGVAQRPEDSKALHSMVSVAEDAGMITLETTQSEKDEFSILSAVAETESLESTSANPAEPAMMPISTLSHSENSAHATGKLSGKSVQIDSLDDVTAAFQAIKPAPEQSVDGAVTAQVQGAVKSQDIVNHAAVVMDEVESGRVLNMTSLPVRQDIKKMDEVESGRVLNMTSLPVRQDIQKIDEVPAERDLDSMPMVDSYKMSSPEKQVATNVSEKIGLENVVSSDSEELEVQSGLKDEMELEMGFDESKPHQVMLDQTTFLKEEPDNLVPVMAPSEETEHLDSLDSFGGHVSPVVEQAAKVTAADVHTGKTQDIKFDSPSSRTMNSSEQGLSASIGQKGGAMDLSQQGQQGQGQHGSGQQSQGQAVQQQFMQMAQNVSQNVQALRQQNMERQAPLILNSDSNLGQSQMASESELLNSATGTTDKRPQLPQGLQTIGLPVNHQRWGQALGQRVVYMANNQLQQAQITLNPEKLGPVQIKLHIDKDQQVHVVMNAQQGVTREAMETAMPRLKEMMEQAGIDLGSVDVSDQQNTSQEQEDEQAAMGSAKVSTEEDVTMAEEASETVVYSADNIVDYYA